MVPIRPSRASRPRRSGPAGASGRRPGPLVACSRGTARGLHPVTRCTWASPSSRSPSSPSYNAVRTDEGGLLGADPVGDRGLPIPEFAAPDVLADLDRDFDANIAQDDCESSRNPCPADEVRVPACKVEASRRDPRLRLLRQAARDLVLVHARRRLPADPGCLRSGRRAARGGGQLPLRQRARRPGRRRAPRPRPGLGGARGPRRRRRRLQHRQGRRLPDDPARLSRAGSSHRAEIAPGNYDARRDRRLRRRPAQRRARRGAPVG